MSLSNIRQQPNCTPFTRELLSRIGDKWSMLIIAHLVAGPMRFNELKRTIGQVSQRMLTLTLRSLEKDGLVSRKIFATIPPKVEYQLTPLGQTLITPVMTLIEWSLTHQDDVLKARADFNQHP